MNNNYHLAIFDIDGTLRVEEKGTVPASTKSAILKLKEHNIPIVICTARSLDGIPANVLELDFEYFICYNGAVIFDKNENVIKDSGISSEDALRLKKYYTDHNETFTYKFLSGKKIKYGNDPWEDFTKRYFKKPIKSPNTMRNVEVDYSIERLLFGTVKLLPNTVDEVRELFPSLTFTQVFDDYYDFTSNQANKGVAIHWLCKQLSLSSENAVAFGDGLNDILMFQSVGMSVAMGNASDEVKQHANYVTTHIEEDGISNAIQHIFFNQ